MFVRWFSCMTLAFLMAGPTTAARAGEVKKASPTVVVRVRSVDTVIDNVKLLVSLAGRENIAQQIEGLIKTKVGPNGLEGIDPKKPFGAYAKMGADLQDAMVVVMFPIADQKVFLGLLENLNFKVAKDKKGLYTVNVGAPFDVSFRFANNYAYVTALNLEALEPANLIDPAKIFPAKQTAAFSASMRLDQIPDAAKLIASLQVEQELTKAKDKKLPGETEKQHDFRVQALQEFARQFQALLKEGGELNVDLDVNRKTNELSLDVNLTGQPKSGLAKEISDLGKATSLFAGLKGPDTAARGLVHFVPPEAVRKAFEAVVDEAAAKALANIQDESKRRQAESLLKALMPTIKAGEIDAAFNFSSAGKGKPYNLVAALKLKDGAELGKIVYDLVADILKVIPPAEAAKIKLDAATAGSVKIHRIDAQEKFDDKAKAIFGENPIFVAFRKDAMFLAVGEGGLSALKEALSGDTAAVTPPFEFNVSVTRIAPLLAKTDEQRQAVTKLLAKNDEGIVRVIVEGGDSLRLRLTTQLSVLQFFSNLAMHAKQFNNSD